MTSRKSGAAHLQHKGSGGDQGQSLSRATQTITFDVTLQFEERHPGETGPALTRGGRVYLWIEGGG